MGSLLFLEAYLPNFHFFLIKLKQVYGNAKYEQINPHFKLAHTMSDNLDHASFLSWKYGHYFPLLQIKDKNILVSCSLCAGARTLSTAKNSNSNLHKHLVKRHASIKLIAKEPSALIKQSEPLHQNSKGLILNRSIPSL